MFKTSSASRVIGCEPASGFRANELRQVDALGDLVRIARWWSPDRALTAADRDGWLEERLSTATTPEQGARVRAVGERAVFAEERW